VSWFNHLVFFTVHHNQQKTGRLIELVFLCGHKGFEKMKKLEIIETNKPTYEKTLGNEQRLTLSPDNWPIAYEEILGDLIGVQTLSIARGLREIQANDKHRDQVAQIVDRLGRYEEETKTAISKHLTRAGLVYEFVSLRGYSQGDWAEVVIYGDKEFFGTLTAEANTLDAWFKGEIYTLSLENLKTYKAEDGESLGRWETEDALSQIVISDSYGIKDFSIDWHTLALDCFGLDITLQKYKTN
jgi:hypothetical protein